MSDRGGTGGEDTGRIARASSPTNVQHQNPHIHKSLLTTYRAFSDGAIVHLFVVAMAVFCVAVWMATAP